MMPPCNQWYTVGSQQGWDTLPMQAVKRLSEIDKDDDTTSSFDLETFNKTPKAENVQPRPGRNPF